MESTMKKQLIVTLVEKARNRRKEGTDLITILCTDVLVKVQRPNYNRLGLQGGFIGKSVVFLVSTGHQPLRTCLEVVGEAWCGETYYLDLVVLLQL